MAPKDAENGPGWRLGRPPAELLRPSAELLRGGPGSLGLLLDCTTARQLSQDTPKTVQETSKTSQEAAETP